MNPSSNNLSKLFRNILLPIAAMRDFIAPAHCVVCKDYFSLQNPHSRFICPKCYDNIPFAESKEMVLNRFNSNFADKSYIDCAVSLFQIKHDTQYLEIIHALKYQKFRSVGLEFGKMLGRRLKIENMADFDFLVPIPIHTAKKRERGFNQSALIAKAIENEISVKMSEKLLTRTKYTITQTLLSKSERFENMKNVFKSSPEVLGKSVLLIDDVLTTGATINSAAKILKESGAAIVGSATLAIAD